MRRDWARSLAASASATECGQVAIYEKPHAENIGMYVAITILGVGIILGWWLRVIFERICKCHNRNSVSAVRTVATQTPPRVRALMVAYLSIPPIKFAPATIKLTRNH